MKILKSRISDEELSTRLESIEETTDGRLAELEEQAQKVVRDGLRSRDATIRTAGRQVCPACHGFGRIQRLDAGYMRRFGLPDWNGCKACGGSHEERGKGFVPA